MNESNKIIQSLWVNGSLNSLQQLCIRSYLDNGHEFHLYTYNLQMNVPSGTILKQADAIIPQKDVFFDDRAGLCSFADLFRYELLYQLGGWWVDMDQVCLKPFDFDSEYVFPSEHTPSFGSQLCIGAIKVPPRSDIMQYCRDTAYKIFKLNFPNIMWGALGSRILNSYIEKNEKLNQYVRCPEVFCPIPYFYFNLLFENFLFDFTSQTYAVHFWNEMLRLKGVDVNSAFHENAFYERVKARYGINNSCG